jgi:N-acyl-D-aspartate/D-glutamate deacylase/amino acid transporter
MTTLLRTLRERDMTLLFIGAVIGSGIFIVPATVLKQMDQGVGVAMFVWIFGGLLSLLGAFTYAELGALNPKAGGLYVFIRDSFGPFPAFLYGWTLFFLISSSAMATLAVAFSAYLGTLVPLNGWQAKAVSVGMIAAVAIVNVRGTRQSSRFQNWTTAIKAGGIVVMGIALLIGGRELPSVADSLWPREMSLAGLVPAVGFSLIGIMWAYEGWQYCTFSAGETIDPQRALPRAFVLGSATLIALYIIANLGYLAALGPARAAASSSIAVTAVDAVLGPSAAKLIAVMILISMISSANALFMTAPRVYYAMARDGLFFRRLAEVHPRYGTPAIAIVGSGAWACLLALSGTFEQLFTFVVFAGWLFYGLAAAAIFSYRRKFTERPFSAPGYPLTPLVFIVSAGAMVVSSLAVDPKRGAIGVCIVLLGAPAYWFWRSSARVGPAGAVAVLVALMGAIVYGQAPAAADADRYDVIISGGRIVDGAGNPWFRADVGITGDRITRIGDLAGAAAARRIDATGLIVSPGFIDPHVHAVGRLFELPQVEGMLREGVTTIVEGNDGSSPLPLSAFLDKVTATHISPNIALFVGHNSVRQQVMGTADRAPSAEELGRMEQLVAAAMEQGALGLSTGLAYVPGNYAKTEELIALSKVAARQGGIYISHMRDEGKGTMESVRETIRIGEEAGLPVQISHIKLGGARHYGKSREVLALIGAARARGVDVTFDQYPYTASATALTLIFPPWSLADNKLLARLADPAEHARIKAGMLEFLDEYMGTDPAVIQLSRCGFDDSLAGKTIADLLKASGRPLTADATADVIIELQTRGGCGAIYHWIGEEDVTRFMQSPLGMIGSDGAVTSIEAGSPHPRALGTYPRVLGRYVREQQVLGLEEAIRRMTSFPAQRLGLPGRGLLREGFAADVAVFDPATVIDKSTFTDPLHYSEGVRFVLVNGQVVIDGGAHTGARPGHALRRGQR